MTDYEKMVALKEHLGYTWQKLASEVGLGSPQTFYDIKAEKIGISLRLTKLLLTTYPQLNPEWLRGDSEEMLLPGFKQVACVDNDSDTEVNFGQFFKDADSAVRYNGSGMAEIPNGAMLALRSVPSTGKLMPGRLYYIKTDFFSDVRVVRQGATSGRIVLCASDSSRYLTGERVFEDMEISESDIKEIYIVLGMVIPYIASDVMAIRQ